MRGFQKVINHSSHVQSHTQVRLRESFKCFIVQERRKMYHRASSARYANYDRSSYLVNSRTDHEAMNSRHPPPLMPNGHLHPAATSPSSSTRTNSSASSRSNSVKERLQNINSSMSWIREELVSWHKYCVCECVCLNKFAYEVG